MLLSCFTLQNSQSLPDHHGAQHTNQRNLQLLIVCIVQCVVLAPSITVAIRETNVGVNFEFLASSVFIAPLGSNNVLTFMQKVLSDSGTYTSEGKADTECLLTLKTATNPSIGTQ